MERALEILALNALGAFVLAIPAAAAGRWIRDPAIVHVLWLVALAKLVVPPVLELSLLPSELPGSAAVQPRELATPSAIPPQMPLPDEEAPVFTAAGEPSTRGEADGPRLATVLLAVEGTGLVLMLALAAARVVRFRRLAGTAHRAPRAVRERAGRVAAALGLRHVPRIRLVTGRIPPLLWPGPPCEIFLPRPLWASLDDEQRDALLAHELAHVRRRDHWVRPLELTAMALFWWNPLAWWVRRNLRAAEEAACDALVLRAPGQRARAYADTLLKTLEFLAGSRPGVVPALATGARDFARIKERLTMIIRNRAPRPLSPVARTALAVLALAALVAGPTWTARAQREPSDPPPPPAPVLPDTPPEEEPSPEVLAELRREQLRLEKQLVELELRREQLQLAAAEAASQAEAARLESDAKRLEAEGEAEEAARLREEAERRRREFASQAERVREEHELRRVETDLQFRLRELEIRHAELSERSRHAEAESTYEEVRRVQRQLERAHREAMRQQLERELKELEELEKQEAAETE